MKIAWSGLKQKYRYFQSVWDGSLNLSDGRILAVEGYAFDTPFEGIIKQTQRQVTWRSQTSGDEDGIILTLDAPPEVRLKFETRLCSFELTWGEIGMRPKVFGTGGIGQKVSVKRLPDVSPPEEISFLWVNEQPPLEWGAYYLKVTQIDGNVAYSSPFYIRRFEAKRATNAHIRT